ncbi:MAG: SGNH/GDSL hydrolase family protein [Myxococcota bacterium]|nr:SGNH/GDSL hydrolase family protein [Myxococcota bacterium]
MLSVTIALTAIVGGWWVQQDRRTDRVLSDTITRQAPEYGPMASALLPDLERAVVVAPDRPHNSQEMIAENRFEIIQRRRAFEVCTDDRGLRVSCDDRPTATNPDYTILCVGDSVVFGWGVTAEESLPSRLQQTLGVTVLNGGIPAMHPESIAAWTRANIEALDPDLILFVRRPAYQQRDPIGNFIDAVRSVVQAADTRPVGVVLPPLSSFDLATGFVTDPVSPADQAVGMIQIGLGSTPVLDVQATYLAAQQALGSGLLRKWVRLERTPSSQRLVRQASEEVVVTVDAFQPEIATEVLRAFEANPRIQEPLFFDGGHPDADGFRVFADAVAGWVREQGWL